MDNAQLLELLKVFGPIPVLFLAVYTLYQRGERKNQEWREEDRQQRQRYEALLEKTVIAITRFNDYMDSNGTGTGK